MIYQNDPAYQFGAISDDERYIAFSRPKTTADTDIFLYDLETQELKHLTPHEGEINFEPVTFSTDSKSLYYLTDEGHEFAYLNRYDIASGQSENVEKTNWDMMYAYFSRNGKYRVSAINNDAHTEIRIVDAATNQQVNLPKLPDGDITSVDISRSETS